MLEKAKPSICCCYKAQQCSSRVDVSIFCSYAFIYPSLSYGSLRFVARYLYIERTIRDPGVRPVHLLTPKPRTHIAISLTCVNLFEHGGDFVMRAQRKLHRCSQNLVLDKRFSTGPDPQSCLCNDSSPSPSAAATPTAKHTTHLLHHSVHIHATHTSTGTASAHALHHLHHLGHIAASRHASASTAH